MMPPMSTKIRTGRTDKVVGLYIVLIFTLASLYYENNYSNMIEAKARITGVVLVMLVGLSLITLVEDIKKYRIQGFGLIDAAVVSFLSSVILSWLLSPFSSYSFYGSCGWRVGTFHIVLLGLSYFIVSRNFVSKRSVFYISCAGIFAVLLIALVNFFGIDSFGLHSGLTDSVAVNYVSTIGNINTFSGYICLILFFLIGMYVKCEDTKKKAVCACLTFISSICALMCNSDSFWVGLFFGVTAVGLYAKRFPEKIFELSEMGVVFFIASAVVSSLLYMGINMPDFDGFTRIYIKSCIWLFALVAFVFVLIVCKKNRNLLVEKMNLLLIVCYGLLTITFVAVVIYSILHFDDTWGTYRGFIWKNTIRMFEQFNLKYKLFGVGTDCFGIVFNNCYGDQIQEIYKMPVLNAHNEFLQYLITNGIIGVMSYGSIYFAVVYNEIKNQKTSISN